MTQIVPTLCARFHRAVELIGSRWTGAIIQILLQGRTRYATLKAAIPDITDRMLSERLRSLEAEALVTRIVVPESPVRVEYELTSKGRSLQDSLREISAWADRWIPLSATRSGSATNSRAKEPAANSSPSRRRRSRPRTARQA